MVEYALMLSLIAIVCLIAIRAAGTNSAAVYQRAATAFSPGAGDGGGGGGGGSGGGGGGGGGKNPPPGCGEGQGNKGPMCP